VSCYAAHAERTLEDVVRLDQRIAGVTREIEGLAARDDRARRLMTIPGIGPIAATALLAAVGDGRQFRRARDVAAWLGLVPREHSTSGKTTLLGISKRGNVMSGDCSSTGHVPA
jgi:transposase